MLVLNELHTDKDLDQAWDKSLEKPVLVFKHSTTCPVSARAFGQFKAYLETSEENADCYMVKVIEDRNISNRIEAETNIKHESPQIMLVKGKEVVWNTSHAKITVNSIEEALQNKAG